MDGAPFALTPKQVEVNRILAGPARNIAIWGGSRSGKTLLLTRAVVMRAAKAAGSRHIIARYRKNHIIDSIGRDTLPKVLKLCFPELAKQVKWNYSDWFVTLPNGSEIWLNGLDDGERIERVLGREFATIYFNECSQISYAAVTMLRTRLAQKTELVNKLYFDLNPSGVSHYVYKMFVDGVDPSDKKPIAHRDSYASAVMNPGDNLTNLSPEYLRDLEAMPEKQRIRFLLGRFQSELDNALWTYERFRRNPSQGEVQRIVVAVDPSGASGPDDKRSDEIGIVAAQKHHDGTFTVLADRTMRGSPEQWARAAVKLYHDLDADCLVAERNYGGSMVESTIRTADKHVKVKLITASRGKHIRAEPISALYELGLVAHHPDGDLGECEDQLCAFSANGYHGERSPDRADALIHALNELSGKGFRGPSFG